MHVPQPICSLVKNESVPSKLLMASLLVFRYLSYTVCSFGLVAGRFRDTIPYLRETIAELKSVDQAPGSVADDPSAVLVDASNHLPHEGLKM